MGTIATGQGRRSTEEVRQATLAALYEEQHRDAVRRIHEEHARRHDKAMSDASKTSAAAGITHACEMDAAISEMFVGLNMYSSMYVTDRMMIDSIERMEQRAEAIDAERQERLADSYNKMMDAIRQVDELYGVDLPRGIGDA